MSDLPLPKRTKDYLEHGAPEGQRNAELLQAAAQFRDAGYNQVAAESRLLERATRDGLTEREALQTIRSAFSKLPRMPITTTHAQPTASPRRTLAPEERARIEAVKAKVRLIAKAKAATEQTLATHAVGFAHYGNTSPVKLIDSDPRNDWQLLLQLFAADDIVWIGRTTGDSASAEHDVEWQKFCATRFRTVAEWLQEKFCPGLFICPTIFKLGSHSRCKDNVTQRRFLVVESDTLDRNQVCAVFHWIEQFTRLRAIVDTAGRSLHGWFEVPPEDTMDQLKTILPVFGCDPALFKLAQPCRLPGAARPDKENRVQSLLYLNL